MAPRRSSPSEPWPHDLLASVQVAVFDAFLAGEPEWVDRLAKVKAPDAPALLQAWRSHRRIEDIENAADLARSRGCHGEYECFDECLEIAEGDLRRDPETFLAQVAAWRGGESETSRGCWTPGEPT